LDLFLDEIIFADDDGPSFSYDLGLRMDYCVFADGDVAFELAFRANHRSLVDFYAAEIRAGINNLAGHCAGSLEFS